MFASSRYRCVPQIVFASSRYRCVPKMASPEARTIFSKKTYYSAIQRKGPTGSTRGGVRSKPRNTKLLLTSLAAAPFISVLARHRCVPKMASPEARKNFSKKTYYSTIQKNGPTGSTRGGCAASLALRNCYYRASHQNRSYRCLQDIVVYLKSPRRRR